jgi:hypothetical protein
MKPDNLKRYHDQTLVVESLLSAHPEFNPKDDPEFLSEEREAFQLVFLPDWSDYGDDYRRAYRHFQEKLPEIFTLSQATLHKFCGKHGIDPTDLIIER